MIWEVRWLTIFHYFFKLHPLRIQDGWKVKENHLYQKPIRERRQKLLILEHTKTADIIQVDGAGELCYTIRIFNADQKQDISNIPYDELVERLEEVIWKERTPRILLRLRIPTGWTVLHHSLTDINPDELAPDSKAWLSYFKQDLLQLKHHEENLVLDVEWFPENDPAGHYAVKLIKDGDWKHPLEDKLCIHPKELSYEIGAVLKKACGLQYKN
ncbi:hypothetical protein DX928_22050 [Bacillus swezeyi]|nr:hypothetical protein DX928_22050 [Bacillus swezeyi]